MKTQRNCGEVLPHDDVVVLDGGEGVESRQTKKTFVDLSMYSGHIRHVHYYSLFQLLVHCSYSHYWKEDGDRTSRHVVTEVGV